jgi:hypothetical protein
MDEVKTVQPGEVSKEEPKVSGTNPTAQPSADEVMAAKIKEMVSKETAELMKQMKSEIQSTKDKAKYEVETALKKARQLELTQAGINQRISSGATSPELARYQAEEEARKVLEREEEEVKSKAEFLGKFQGNLKTAITELGEDPENKEIDWALDAPDFFTAQSRILKSVAKLKKSKDSKAAEEMKKQVAEAVAKARQELGLDSVDTSASSGTSVSGIPTNMAAFRKWVAKVDDKEYVKLKPKIDEMLLLGQIK